MFCREQVARYSERLSEFEELGARLAAIGNGNALMAKDFVERFDVRFDVYTDPSLASYKAARFKRGLKLNAGMLKSAWRALSDGHIQGRTKGDALQLGGVMVMGPDAEVVFTHTDDAAGDHASIDDVLAALRSAAEA